MRRFECFTHETGSSVPAVTFLLAADEVGARRLILGELRSNRLATSVDVYEDGKLLWSEQT